MYFIVIVCTNEFWGIKEKSLIQGDNNKKLVSLKIIYNLSLLFKFFINFFKAYLQILSLWLHEFLACLKSVFFFLNISISLLAKKCRNCEHWKKI